MRAPDQVQLWSRSYERELTSVLELQKAISAGIAEQVRSWLAPLAKAGVARRQTTNPQAYDCYLRGLFMQRLRTPAAVASAIRLFEEATALDPSLAQAWWGCARFWPIRSLPMPRRRSGGSGSGSTGTGRPASRRCARPSSSARRAQTFKGFLAFTYASISGTPRPLPPLRRPSNAIP